MMMHATRAIRCALAFLMWVGVCHGVLRGGEFEATDAGGVPVTIRLLDDEQRSATIFRMEDATLHLHDAPPLPVSMVLSLERASLESGDAEPSAMIHLRDGSRLVAELLSWTPEEATFTFRGASVSVPSPHLQAWVHPLAADAGARAGQGGEMDVRPDGAGTEDRIHAELDGRAIQLGGLLNRYGDGAWTLQHGGAERTLRGERVRRIDFAQTARVDEPRPEAALLLIDGTRLHGALQGASAAVISFQSPALGDMEIPWDTVRRVEWFSDRVLYLDTLDPVEVREASLAAPPLPFRRNTSVYGTPMRMQGESFARGIGVHAQSSLAYRIEPDLTAFTAVIGLDDTGGGIGDCVFWVEVDGETLFRKRVTGDTPPTPIRVPVQGGRHLRLVVEFGERLDIGDNANWARARLIREPSAKATDNADGAAAEPGD